jgi:hypothetical protein
VTWHELAKATVALADDGRPTPCTADPAAFHANRRKTRIEAATACTWCPLAVQCGRYALDAGQAWGVWGGVDLTRVAGVPDGRRELEARLKEVR